MKYIITMPRTSKSKSSTSSSKRSRRGRKKKEVAAKPDPESDDEVTNEADFYGSMDGASKFVKGDAIAGILILFINILHQVY